jgi:hypothetical protein
MHRVIQYWQVIGFFFILISGTLFHFIYEWTGREPLVGLISPINESVWEHLKLVLYPTLLFSIFEYLAIGHILNNYLSAKIISILASTIIIVVLFYSYTYLLGRNYLFLDILTFIIGTAVGQILSYTILTTNPLPGDVPKVLLILLLLLIFLFTFFTFYPPRLPIFKSSPDGTYGIYHFR